MGESGRKSRFEAKVKHGKKTKKKKIENERNARFAPTYIRLALIGSIRLQCRVDSASAVVEYISRVFEMCSILVLMHLSHRVFFLSTAAYRRIPSVISMDFLKSQPPRVGEPRGAGAGSTAPSPAHCPASCPHSFISSRVCSMSFRMWSMVS